MFPKAGAVVSKLRVRDRVPNTSSIAASLDDWEELPGIREVPLIDDTPPEFYSVNEQRRVEALAQAIEASGEIDPLILVMGDPQYPDGYILEGVHRYNALRMLKKTSFPAKVVIDRSDKREASLREAADAHAEGGLICMGREIALVLRSGRELELPKRVGMLYDDAGKYWPKCSLLIARFDNGECKVDDGDARAYFGRSTTVYEGKVLLPPKALTKWRRVGEVKEIFYDRAGDRASGPFRHEFNKPRGSWKLIHWMKGKAARDPAVLYRLERNVYRVELPDGCIVGDRGIALP